jgi:chromosome partitioning protein
MITIGFISQKGGVGKTTIAIHLATAFQSSGRETLVVDLDPQASAAEWKDARTEERPYVMAVPSSRLKKTLETAREHEAEVVVLDTAPHSEGTALEAARASDLILVPCQPSIMDLRAMRKTADLLNHLKKPTYAVLNEVAAQGSVADDAARAITAQFEMPVCPVRIGQRVAFNRCLLAGQTAQEYEPDGKASQEIAAFLQWAGETVGLSASGKSRERTSAKEFVA